MTTPSSILDKRIPWTEEPGGLQSMESQRVGHDYVIEYTRGVLDHRGKKLEGEELADWITRPKEVKPC